MKEITNENHMPSPRPLLCSGLPSPVEHPERSPALLAGRSRRSRRERGRGEGRKMFHQQPMHKNIPAADFAEEDALGAVVQEADVVERDGAVAVEHEAECKVLDTGRTAIDQPKDQPKDQPSD